MGLEQPPRTWCTGESKCLWAYQGERMWGWCISVKDTASRLAKELPSNKNLCGYMSFPRGGENSFLHLRNFPIVVVQSWVRQILHPATSFSKYICNVYNISHKPSNQLHTVLGAHLPNITSFSQLPGSKFSSFISLSPYDIFGIVQPI